MQDVTSQIIYKKLEEAKKLSTINPDKSYEISKDAYNMAVDSNRKPEQGYSLIRMVIACRAKSEIILMLNYSLKALELFEEENEVSGQILALNLIGIAYFYSSKYEDALKYMISAKELLSNSKDDYLLSSVLNNIGEVYRESEKYDSSIEYYNLALEISIKNDYKLNIAAIFSNIGEVYFQTKDYVIALEYFNKSYDILRSENDMVTLGEVENKLGKTYYELKNYDVAEDFYFKSLDRLNEINNKYYIIDVLINFAMLKLQKDINKSIIYYEKAMELAIDIDSNKKISDIYKLISEYYEKIQDYRTALVYYKYYSGLNEEISATDTRNKLEILKIEMGYLKENDKFERIKKNLEREILHQKIEIEKIKKSSKMFEKSAYEDELTGVPNRRYINNYLNKLLNGHTNLNEEIALYMIDIDFFKKYNDCWGHSQGDECLKEVAKCIKEIQIKRNDVFGRYGGEEFVYVARNINYEKSLELGEFIRKSVQDLNILFNVNDTKKNITISIGGTIFKTKDINSLSTIMQSADKQLYKAKDMGRNKVIVIEEL